MRVAALLLIAAACGKSSGGASGSGSAPAPIPAGPRADCGPVADQLASLELGNYAEAETRTPAVARWRAACEAAAITVDEAACIAKATDTWIAAQCAPRMFPQLASTVSGDCAAVVAKTKAAMSAQAKYLSDPNIAGWFNTTMKVMEQSCVEDHWPDALKRCILATDIQINAPAALGTCNAQMPAALLQKLQARLVAAMPNPAAGSGAPPSTP